MHILFDASRLVARSHLAAPTGIDRVDMAYAAYLSQTRTPASFVVGKSFPRIIPMARAKFLSRAEDSSAKPDANEEGQRVYADICGLLSRPAAEWRTGAGAQRFSGEQRNFPLVDRLSAQLRHRAGIGALPARFRNATYLHTSHAGLENASGIDKLKSRGARVVVMVHDLIPIDYPEFCRPGEDVRHENRLLSVQRRADLILVNSAYTRERMLAWGDARRLALPQVRVVPLGVAPRYLARDSLRPPRARRPYFVTVGTIEPRKNHAFLLKLWRRLAEEMGPACPVLVVIGRRGWEMEAVADLLERCPPLARNVVEVSGLDDDAVASLMAGARAVVQPSMVEGFSLPVAEAHAVGARVLASDIDAHRELAGPLTTLIDPYDGPGWLAAFRRLAAAPSPPAAPCRNAMAQAEHVKSAMAEIASLYR
jgi:glycosyltransferase involved in cell wall biosynthesis